MKIVKVDFYTLTNYGHDSTKETANKIFRTKKSALVYANKCKKSNPDILSFRVYEELFEVWG